MLAYPKDQKKQRRVQHLLETDEGMGSVHGDCQKSCPEVICFRAGQTSRIAPDASAAVPASCKPPPAALPLRRALAVAYTLRTAKAAALPIAPQPRQEYSQITQRPQYPHIAQLA